MTIEATAGVPCALVITRPFVAIRDRIAEMLGVPGFPSTVLDHPLSIRTREELRLEAERVAFDVVAQLRSG